VQLRPDHQGSIALAIAFSILTAFGMVQGVGAAPAPSLA
jgi:hypothetical protein